jgi:tight adherence protein B
VRIYTAQARVTGWVVALLPMGLFFVMQALNPGYENLLVSDPLGRTFIYVGLFFWTIGILIIKKIVTIKI